LAAVAEEALVVAVVGVETTAAAVDGVAADAAAVAAAFTDRPGRLTIAHTRSLRLAGFLLALLVPVTVLAQSAPETQLVLGSTAETNPDFVTVCGAAGRS